MVQPCDKWGSGVREDAEVEEGTDMAADQV